uniref:Uncharacterized protein n=1 Tax=Glossina pallidipes TaxID=7398 RepID=A0A1A9Z775_GLOPL
MRKDIEEQRKTFKYRNGGSILIKHTVSQSVLRLKLTITAHNLFTWSVVAVVVVVLRECYGTGIKVKDYFYNISKLRLNIKYAVVRAKVAASLVTLRSFKILPPSKVDHNHGGQVLLSRILNHSLRSVYLIFIAWVAFLVGLRERFYELLVSLVKSYEKVLKD